MFNKPLPWSNRRFNSYLQLVIKPSCSFHVVNTVELPLVKMMEQSVVEIYITMYAPDTVVQLWKITHEIGETIRASQGGAVHGQLR